MMTDIGTAANSSAPEPFASLSELQNQHIALMREIRSSRGERCEVDLIDPFLQRARASGARIDDFSERDVGQSILDYWTTVLINARNGAGDLPNVPVLAEFDLSQADDLADKPSPFKGLNAFQEADADWFFGREDAVKGVTEIVAHEPLVAVVGPSGSGKSSLVLAGLMPRLRRGALPGSESWRYLPTVTPGGDPLLSLLQAVCGNEHDTAGTEEKKRKLERTPSHFRELATLDDRPVVLVVDQFEELFTLCSSQSTRTTFVEALLSILQPVDRNRVVLTIREDYVEQARLLPGLGDPGIVFRALPFTSRELRHVIEEPANSIGLKIDRSIVDDLVTEVIGDPTALPLLQFTLKQLWEHRERNRITWDTYRKVGKPSEALKRTAERIYNDLRTFENHQTAERIFLTLAQPSVGAEFLRRKVFRQTLEALEAPDRVNRVLQRFTDSGLIIRTAGIERDEDRFEVAHETLIRNWPRLAGWLRSEKAQSEKLSQLVATAQLWHQSGHKEGYLLRGGALAEAKWFENQAPELKELVGESEKAEAWRNSLRNLAVACVGGCLIAAGAAAILYYQKQSATAVTQREKAITAVLDVTSEIRNHLKTGALPIPAATGLSKVLLKTEGEIFHGQDSVDGAMKIRLSALKELSDIFENIGDSDNALSTAQQAKKIAYDLSKQNPNKIDWKYGIFTNSLRTGNALAGGKLKQRGNYVNALIGAEKEYNQALNIAKEMSRMDVNPKYKANIALAHRKIGDIYLIFSDNPSYNGTEYQKKAISEYENALLIYSGLSGNERSNLEYRTNVATLQTALGDAHEKLKDNAEAARKFNTAVASLREIVGLQPMVGDTRSNLSSALQKLANVKKSEREFALSLYREALGIKVGLSEQFPSNVTHQIGLARGYENFGDFLRDSANSAAEDGEKQLLREQARTEYNNAIKPSICRNALEASGTIPAIVRLQKRVKRKLANLTPGAR